MRVLILANTVLMLLFLSCSSSEQPMSLATSDYGTDGAGTFNQIKFNLVRKGEQVNSSYYTSGCSSIKPDGTCQALVTYSGTGEFIGQSIGIVTSPTGRITADTTGCPKIAATKQSCKITLAHVVGNPIHTLVKIYVGRESRTIATFNTDLAVTAQTLGSSVGASDLINIAAAALGPVAGDKIEGLLGIGGPSEEQFQQLASQVSAIATTVNQILNRVQQLTNIEILDFNRLEATITGSALATELQKFNTSILSGKNTYTLFESATINGQSGCTQTIPIPYSYQTEAEIAAAITAGTSAVPSAWGCLGAACANLNQAYQDASGLIVSGGAGLKGFDANVFQAINNKIFSDLTSQFSAEAFQKNNESIILYALLITSSLQKSYNMLHAALYLAQNAKLPSFSNLVYPVSNPLMSPNFSYLTNKHALNLNFTDMGNQLLEDVEAAIISDNPGDPTKLWAVNTQPAYSPKLLAAGLTAIPTSNNWAANCNIYEWAGAKPVPASYVPATLTTTCVNGVQTTALATPPASMPADYVGALTTTQLTANCYYSGQPNSTSIQFSNCLSSLSPVAPATQANINSTLTASPYLECNAPSLSNLELAPFQCLANNCVAAINNNNANNGQAMGPVFQASGDITSSNIPCPALICSENLPNPNPIATQSIPISLTLSNLEVALLGLVINPNNSFQYNDNSPNCGQYKPEVALTCLNNYPCASDATGMLTITTKSGKTAQINLVNQNVWYIGTFSINAKML